MHGGIDVTPKKERASEVHQSADKTPQWCQETDKVMLRRNRAIHSSSHRTSYLGEGKQKPQSKAARGLWWERIGSLTLRTHLQPSQVSVKFSILVRQQLLSDKPNKESEPILPLYMGTVLKRSPLFQTEPSWTLRNHGNHKSGSLSLTYHSPKVKDNLIRQLEEEEGNTWTSWRAQDAGGSEASVVVAPTE